MKEDEKLFKGKFHEQDSPEAAEAVEEEVEEEAEVEEEVVDDRESIEVSLDSISDAVKELRSGHSVDDSRMKEQLRNYFDRLDALEKEALLTFMRAFAGILTGGFTGSDAPDPSDPPSSITMSGEEEEEEVEFEEEIPEEGAEVAVKAEEAEEEEEDTSPPIKVGTQDLAEIRKRVRKLMI